MYMGLNSGGEQWRLQRGVRGQQHGIQHDRQRKHRFGHAALLATRPVRRTTAIGDLGLAANSVGEENTRWEPVPLLSEFPAAATPRLAPTPSRRTRSAAYNSAFGFQSLFGTPRRRNTAWELLRCSGARLVRTTSPSGYPPFSGSQNATAEVAVAIRPAKNDSSGSGDNTAIGYNALNGTQLATVIPALGSAALVSNASGSDNVAVGRLLSPATNREAKTRLSAVPRLIVPPGTGNTADLFRGGPGPDPGLISTS